jgi:hypothetical protein
MPSIVLSTMFAGLKLSGNERGGKSCRRGLAEVARATKSRRRAAQVAAEPFAAACPKLNDRCSMKIPSPASITTLPKYRWRVTCAGAQLVFHEGVKRSVLWTATQRELKLTNR